MKKLFRLPNEKIDPNAIREIESAVDELEKTMSRLSAEVARLAAAVESKDDSPYNETGIKEVDNVTENR